MIKHVIFNNRIIVLGFGSMAKALLPLLWRHLEPHPSQFTIINDKEEGKEIAARYDITDFRVEKISRLNCHELLKPLLKAGDILLNLSVNISSVYLIKICNELNSLYIDLSTEPWEGEYTNRINSPSERSNYSLRESCLALKPFVKPTTVITHGANPGLVSHLVKKALLNVAEDNNLDFQEPKNAKEWANLAYTLDIKAIHISENDTQWGERPYNPNEFLNTWSVDGFISEALQPAELGWGTHERSLPKKGKHHDYGCGAAIYLNLPGAAVKVRSWNPCVGSYHGYLITHAESISISDYLTLYKDEQVLYRPTVHYAYLPCPQAQLSLQQLMGKEGKELRFKHILLDEIKSGHDILGVLLMGNAKGAYWYGSILSVEEARTLAPYNSATSLQVVAGALGAILWAMEHPNQGLVEPEEVAYQYVLDIATPYLGTVAGHYTDWTPLDNRGQLFEEEVNRADPWQFSNILVNH